MRSRLTIDFDDGTHRHLTCSNRKCEAKINDDCFSWKYAVKNGWKFEVFEGNILAYCPDCNKREGD